jgi:hypothetical protein
MTEDNAPPDRITLGVCVDLIAESNPDGTYRITAGVNDLPPEFVTNVPSTTTQGELRAMATALEDAIESRVRAYVSELHMQLHNPTLLKLVQGIAKT